MEERRRRLGQLVRARRLALGMSQAQAAATGGISDTSWGLVEKGGEAGEKILAGVDRGISWRPGSAQTVLEDGEPTEIMASPGDDESRLDAVERQVADALQFIENERANLAREREAVRVEREELLRDRARILAEIEARLGPPAGTEEPNDSPAA